MCKQRFNHSSDLPQQQLLWQGLLPRYKSNLQMVLVQRQLLVQKLLMELQHRTSCLGMILLMDAGALAAGDPFNPMRAQNSLLRVFMGTLPSS